MVRVSGEGPPESSHHLPPGGAGAGSAPDGNIQREFEGLAHETGERYGGQCSFVFTYDEPLSHLIYAGSDMIAVPSMFEPCGLTQMIAMRFGAPPLRRSALRTAAYARRQHWTPHPSAPSCAA